MNKLYNNSNGGGCRKLGVRLMATAAFFSLGACVNVQERLQIAAEARGNWAGSEPADASVAPLRDAPLHIPMGGNVNAPIAYLELCTRSPEDCAKGPDTDLALLAQEAGQARLHRIELALGINDTEPTPATEAQYAPVTPAVASLSPAPAYAQPQNSPMPMTGSIPDAAPRLSWGTKVQSPPAAMAPAPVAASYSLAAELYPSATSLIWLDPVEASLAWAVQPEAVRTPVQTLSSGWTQMGALMPVQDASAKAPQDNHLSPGLSAYPTLTGISAHAVHGKPAISMSSPLSLGEHNTAFDENGYAMIDETVETRALVEGINHLVNHAIWPEDDQRQYGVPDYWVAPGIGRGARGDCEDYALEKRRELIAAGIPARALSIALVRTRQGEDHAILILSTSEGDLVLDNRTSEIKLWSLSGYHWISRQAPDQPLAWFSVEDANLYR